jgi:hypothetical protein
MMHLAGFPLSSKVGKKCNPAYCDSTLNADFFKKRFEEIKQRFFP